MASIDIRARSKRAYELARLRLGLRAAWPIVPIAALSALWSNRVSFTVVIGSLLFCASVALRTRGQAYGRAFVPGLVAGATPLLFPLALRTWGHCCIGQACLPACLLGCVAGGFVAGLFLGTSASQERENRSAFLLSSTLIAGLTGMLGCGVSGVSGVLGMAAAMVATSLPLSLASKARG